MVSTQRSFFSLKEGEDSSSVAGSQVPIPRVYSTQVRGWKAGTYGSVSSAIQKSAVSFSALVGSNANRTQHRGVTNEAGSIPPLLSLSRPRCDLHGSASRILAALRLNENELVFFWWKRTLTTHYNQDFLLSGTRSAGVSRILSLVVRAEVSFWFSLRFQVPNVS